jgi:DNA replication protein DnaD
LTDAQLEQAEIAAKARGDAEQLDAIMKEKAMRASERSGMAGAFNNLPYSRQEQMMAGGGMAVAFKNGGDEGEKTSMAGDLLRSIADPIMSGVRATAEYGKLKEERDRARPGFFEQLTPTERQERLTRAKEFSNQMKQVGGSSESKPADKSADKFVDPYKGLSPTRRADFEDGAKQQISPVVKRGLSELAASKGMSEDDLMNSTKKMMAYFESRSKPEMDKLQAMINKGSNDSKEAKEQMLGKALAQYGFQWAANASKPGARLLSSAAESSPAIAQSVAESQKLARDIEQNQLKLNMSMQQFRIAQSKGDEQAAINFAQQVRQLKQSEQMLALKQQELSMQGQALGMKQNQFNAMMGARMASAGAQNKQAQARLAKVGTDASFKYDENNRRTRDELIKMHGPVAGDAMYKLGRKQYINDAMQYASDSMSDTQSSGGGGGGARNVFDLLEN